MLKNAYFLAKIGADTAENEQHFAEILPIGRRVADRGQPVRGLRRGADGGVEGESVGLEPRGAHLAEEREHRRFAAGRDVRDRRLAKFRQNVARFRLYRHRFLQENMRFAAFSGLHS